MKLSSEEQHKALYDTIRDALYTLGFILTEKGIRTYISPLDRVLSYSKSKLQAVKDIVRQEMRTLKDRIRIAVVTDFEFSNALSLQKLDNVLDEECGGAISVIKELVSDEELDSLNPVMVTGKSLLCDDDINLPWSPAIFRRNPHGINSRAEPGLWLFWPQPWQQA